MRPFQIIITENGKKHGIVFCITEDAGNHYKRFTDGEYAVDSLRLVLMIDPEPELYSISITQTNEFNKKCGIALERWTLRDFWERYFGAEEYEVLVEYLNEFNEKVNGIIGFNTITIPTEWLFP